MVALVQDDDTVLAQEQGKPVLEEGHLIAHIRVSTLASHPPATCSGCMR